MTKLGLIGFPLSHSFSPGYFNEKFTILGLGDTYSYKPYPIENIQAIDSIWDLGLLGFNVTIPYKEAIIPYLDDLSPEAKEIGAVNTVLIKDEITIGYNTDAYGFEMSIDPFIKEKKNLKALILGTGGASKAIAYVLNKKNIPFQFVSRSDKYLQYHQLTNEIVQEHLLIINTTPLGMSPNINTCPAIPYSGISTDHILYDLVYNPEKTVFLSKGMQHKASIKNGLEMLHLQAEKAWDIWNTK